MSFYLVPSSVENGRKTSFFEELQALQNPSDDDDDGDDENNEDANELVNLCIPKKPLWFPPPLSSSVTSHSASEAFHDLPSQRRDVVDISMATSTIPRVTSSLRSIRTVAETPAPALERKTSLLRHDISAEVTPTTSFTTDSPLQPQTNTTLLERQITATPTFGSVFMANSAGIMNMLNNNPKKQPNKTNKKNTKNEAPRQTKKRKSASISMVSEADQILKGIHFFYVPANDFHPGRKRRILKVREYGGVWAKVWTSSVGYVVVDDPDITFDQTLKYLKDDFQAPEIPSNVIFVSGDFPLDCIAFKKLLEHNQPKYKVKGSILEPAQNPLQELSKKLDKPSLEGCSPNQDMPPTPGISHGSPQAYSPVFNFPESQVHIGNRPYLVESSRVASPTAEVQYESFGKDFDELLKESKTMQDLPFDDEDCRLSPSETYGGGDSDDCMSEGERERKASVNKKKRRAGPMPTQSFNQASFSCMKGGTVINLESNPNRPTIEILQQMASYYERINFLNDEWRAFSYKRAAGMLKKQTKKISTYEEAIAITHIGHRLATKIDEIARTDRLRKLDNVRAEPDDLTLQLFGGVYGVGPSRAHKWVRAGYKTLKDLAQKAELSVSQKIGIDHYDDFNTRIPREEVTALGEIVQVAAAGLDSSIEIIISGSYRRGVSDSGDIDCMITKTGTTSSSELLRFLNKLVQTLTDSKFLVAALAVPDYRKDDGSKWHGACVLPASKQKVWRRIDFLLVPASEFGAALIYFTGDDIFNRSLRLLAGKKGMRLNQRGLYTDVMRGQDRVKITEGTLVEGANEKRIFEILDVPWREPHNRICH